MSSSSTHMPTLEDRDRAKETPSIRHLSRREMLGLVGTTAIAVTFAGCGGEQSGSSSSPSSAGRRPTPEGLGSGSGAPNLPEGFADTFTSRYVNAKNRPLTMPVLAIGGAESWGEAAGEGMKPAADDVQTVVIPNTCHWVAEQAPEEMVAALTEFLDPYRENGGNLR